VTKAPMTADQPSGHHGVLVDAMLPTFSLSPSSSVLRGTTCKELRMLTANVHGCVFLL